jgi:TPR repeat protein
MKAAINMANIFRVGIGVKPDPELAVMWLLIAADGGEDVKESLRTANLEINKHQLDDARQQARAWRAQHHLEAVPPDVASTASGELSHR